MTKRLKACCDYGMLFGAICLIPTGPDGAMVLPLWGSASIIGAFAAGRLGLFLRDRATN